MADYFLISLSNKENLKLCIKHALAGFTNSINGLWTFFDIDVGDYVSFLYGARVRNLYRVTEKVAYKNAENLPPWPRITFRSKRTYYFPFRLFLRQEREFNEPMVRPEFSYVAENLLLRGGYRKTHFQADTVTFYNVSEMGTVFDGETEHLELNAETFEPTIVFKRENQRIPEKFYFKELILQSLVRRKIQNSILKDVLKIFGVDNAPDEFEVLGEKALPEGYVDLFIKLKHPTGSNKYLLVEVKTGKAQRKDLEQLRRYLREFTSETVGGLLIAKDFSKSTIGHSEILPVRYNFKNLDISAEYSYEELLKMLELEVIV
ncbi:hypothetical protein [Thermococcus sp. 21S7]|uniref:hypothetical protein n=1 Tax=Thermococcus sp. 21S7 TaxID=1638221 RepID=UPI00143A0EE8|nr:hypothetical protein [Thermococcus sp. 21S7]NJE62005.1 hypothetical protein [Thermococcus sp. 21S7]